MATSKRLLQAAAVSLFGLIALAVVALPGSARADLPPISHITLTEIITTFTAPIGIDHYEPTNELAISANYPTGFPFNLELVDQTGTHHTFSGLSGLTDELKIATVRFSSCLGGFAPGEFFTGNGNDGEIVRIDEDGVTVQNPWVDLGDGVGLMRGGLFQDKYCVADGDLVVATTQGQVWRINHDGQATFLAQVTGVNDPVHLEGITTVPNDPVKYGPWAGKILAGAEAEPGIYAIDPNDGSWTFTALPVPGGIIRPEDIDIVEPNENFYGVAYEDGQIIGVPAEQWADKVGDVLIAQEYPGILSIVRWDGAEFVTEIIADFTTSYEHVTFSPAGVPPLSPVNQPPIALEDARTTPVDTPVTVTALDNDTDPDEDPISISSVGTPSNGSASTDGTTILYTPNPGFVGVDTFTYDLVDGVPGHVSTATVTITIVGDNTAPDAVDDSATTPVNTPVIIPVLDNDTDPENDTLTVAADGGSSARTAILSAGASLLWECRPASGAVVDDQTGSGNTGTMGAGTAQGAVTSDCADGSFAFPGVPDAVVSASSSTLPAGAAPRTVMFRFKANFADPGYIGLFGYGTNETPLGQFSLARTGAGNDQLTFASWGNDTTLVLPPGTDLGDGADHTIAVVYDGATTLTPYVDGVAGTPATIAPLNTVPAEVKLGQTLYGSLGAGDELRQLAIFPSALDAATVAALDVALNGTGGGSAVSDPANGTATTDGTTVTYTPDSGFTGVDTFTYTITDGNGGSDTATVTVTVVSDNNVLAVDDAETTTQNNPVTVYVLANDLGQPDSTLTIDSFGDPANGTVVTGGTMLVYMPDPDFVGVDVFPYTISSDLGGQSSALVTITVTPAGPNTPPIAVDDAATTPVNTPVSVSVLTNDSDPDGDTISISAGALAFGSILAEGPSLYWACLAEPDATTVADLSGNANDGAVANVAPGMTTSDCAGGSAMQFNNGTATVSAAGTNLPAGASPRTVVVRFKANLIGLVDVGLFGYGTNAVNYGQFSIARTSAGNDKLVFASWGNDTLLQLPPGTDISDGLEHTIVIVYDGANTLTPYVDGVAGSPSSIAPLDTVPGSVYLGQTVYGAMTFGDEMRHYAIFPTAFDASDVAQIDSAIDSAVAAQAFSQPSNGTVSQAGDELVYTPNTNYTGTDSFVYSIGDGRGGFDSAVVTVTIEGALIAQDDFDATTGTTPVTVEVLDNDSSEPGAILTVDSVEDPANGTATTDGTTVTYTADPGFTGVDVFQYQVSDDLGNTTTATVTITVTAAANNPPDAVDDAESTDVNVPVVVPVLDNDSDPDGDPIHVGTGFGARSTILGLSPSMLWECFNGTATAADASGNGVVGTITGGVSGGVASGDCDGGAAFLIPGGAAVVNASSPGLPAGNAARSVMVRFKANYTDPGDIGLFAYGTNGVNYGQFSIARTSAGNDKLIFASWANDALLQLPPGTNLGDGDEHTIVVVYDGAGTLTAYVDGVAGTPVAIGPLDTVDSNVTLGQTLYGAQGFGDESRQFAVFPAALSAGDIADLHAAIEVAATLQALTDPANGSVTTNGTTVTYTPDTDFVGTDTFQYTISDGRGGTDTATVTVEILASVDAIDDATTTHAGVPVDVDVLSNDTGTGALEVIDATDPDNGSVTFDGDSVTYTPDPGFTGADTFEYTISGVGGEDTATVTVTVYAVVDAVDDSGTTTPETPVTVAVLDNDTGDEAGTLEVVSTTDPDNGSVTTDGTTVTYTPDAGFAGVDTFTYTIEDGLGGSDTATVTITVTSPIEANDDSDSTQFETPVTVDVLANDSGDESATLEVVSTSDPDNGSVTTDGTTVTYTPDAGFAGVDTFTYTIEDGLGGSATATVTITVRAELVANDDSDSTQFETPVTVDVLGNDTGDLSGTIEVVLATDPANGSVTVNPDGTITYTPDAGFAGTDSFTYTIEDGLGGSDTATVTITVTAQLVANNDSATTPYETPVTVPVLGNDTGDLTATIEVVSTTDPANGSVTVNPDGTITYTPDAGFAGTDSFTYTIEDGLGGSDTATVTITVYAQLVAVDDSESTPFETPVTVDVLDNDSADAAGTLEVTSATDPANGSVTTDGETVTYTPDAGFVGVDSFTYTVADGLGQSTTATVTVTVYAELVANDDAEDTPYQTPVTVSVLGNDTGDLAATIEVVSTTLADNGTVTTDGTTVTYTPDAGFAGVDTFTYTIVDGLGSSDVATVTITVYADLVAADDSAATPFETPVTVSVLGNDTGDAAGTIEVVSTTDPANGSVTVNPDGTITYTPDAGFAGTDTFTYTIEDGLGDSDTATVTITVYAQLNAVDDTAATQPETAVEVDVLANDTGDAQADIEVISTTDAANGSVTFDFNSVTYTPDPGFTGTDTFTYTIEDGLGSTATATVTVTVTALLVAVDDTAETQQDTPVNVAVLGNDSADVTATMEVVSTTDPANGSVTVNPDGTVTYTPDAGFSGIDTFTYTVEDGLGGSETATVTVTVTAAPRIILAAEACVAIVVQPFSAGYTNEFWLESPGTPHFLGVTNNSTPGTTVALGTFTAGTELVFSIHVQQTGDVFQTGPAAVNADNRIHAQLTPGTGDVLYTVGFEDIYNGGDLDFNDAVFDLITIDCGVDAIDDVATTDEGEPVTVAVLANDESEHGTLAVTSTTDPANGTVTVNPDGTITYTPDAGFSGTDTFTYTVENGLGGTDTATVTVTVAPAPRVVLAADACLAIVVQAYSAGYTNDFWLESPGTPHFLGASNHSTPGTTVALGTFTAGTELVFSIHVNQTGEVFQTGPAAGNPDGLVHVALTPGSGDVLYTVGFEDLTNGGDLDFNDAVFDLIAIDCGIEAADDSATTLEDTPVTVSVLTNDATDHGTLVVTSVTDGANGTVATDGTTATYTPDAGFSGIDTFTYTVENGLGGTDTATVTVTVNPLPDAVDDTATSDGAPVTITVLGNDDGHGGPLTVTSVTNGANGSVTTDGTTAVYTPNPGFYGTDTFTYTVDNGFGTATATVTVTVDAPRVVLAADACLAIVVQAYSAGYTNQFWLESPGTPHFLGVSNHSTPGTTVALGSFTAGTELIFSIHVEQTGDVFQTGPGSRNADGLVHTAVTPGTGDVLYTVGFEDLLNGGDLDFNDAVFDLTTIDCGVEAADDADSTPAGQPVTTPVLDNDATDHGTLVVTSVTDGANGSVTTDGTTTTYAPNPGFTGTDSYTYTVENGLGGTDTATVTVTVHPLPEAADDTATSNESTPVTISVMDNDDGHGGTLTVTGATNGTHGTTTTNGTTVVYTPNPGYAGTDTFQYTVSNGYGTATATVTVTVINSSRVLIANAGCIAIVTRASSASYTDTIWLMAPGSAHSLGVTNKAAVGTQVGLGFYPGGTELVLGIKTNVGSYTWKTGPASVNPDDYQHARLTAATTAPFLYLVEFEDLPNGGDMDHNDTVFDVITVPCTLTATDDSTTAVGGTPKEIDVLDNDSASAGGLTLTSVSTPAHGTAEIEDGEIEYTPVTGYTGSDSFTYTVTDAAGGTATATVTVAVSQPNRAPEASNDSSSTKKGKPVTIDVLANDSDPDGDELTVVDTDDLSPSSARGSLSIVGNKVKFTPKSSFTGTATFEYTVSDGRGKTDTATVTVTVLANRAPNAANDSATTPKNQTVFVNVLANDTDPDGDTLAIEDVEGISSSQGTVSIVGGQIKFVPKTGFTGTVKFDYEVEDPDGASDEAEVTITVGPNRPPVAVVDSATVKKNNTVYIDVLDNDSDPDNDALTLVSVVDPSNGSTSISSGKVKFTPSSNFWGTVTFSYTMKDTSGATATATVTVTVTKH